MPADQGPVFVVSHTHWDREWYRPFHDFRVDMARVVGEVLDRLEEDGAFRHFVLDGQSILVEDHLALRPEDEPRLRAQVEAGRLSLGPLYVLPDEFLVSGEALVRNLLLGTRTAARFGGWQRVGYLPDSFGHVAQLPQILARAGIDSFVYTRGNGAEIDELGSEYRWLAPDGSEVLAVNQEGGYCNAGGLGHEELWHAHTRRRVDPALAVAKVGELLERLAARSNAGVLLLNNGCDHFPPQRDFAAVLAAIAAAFPEREFRHGSYADFLSALRALPDFSPPAFAGELRQGRHHPILSGVWSARMPLKQLNARAQRLLERNVEPARAALHFLHGLDYPAGEITAAWKLLLANHPHDSICGCSTDAVHREMIPRFEGVLQAGERLLGNALAELAPSFAPEAKDDRETVIAVFNPLPRPRDAVVRRMVVLQPFGDAVERLALFDESGARVPCEILRTEYVERFWGIDHRSVLDGEAQAEGFDVYRQRFGPRILRDETRAGDSDCHLSLRFLAADLPALGHARFFLREADAPPAPPAPRVSADGDRLESELYRIRLRGDGSFDLELKSTGEVWENLHVLEDEGDAGDEYDFSPAGASVLAAGVGGTVAVADAGGLVASLATAFDFPLPARLAADRESRAAATVPCRVRIQVTLRANSPLIEIETRFDNRAEDHRLRARFATPIRTDTLVSDAHFQLIARPLAPPAGEGWVQPPCETLPQLDYSLVEDGERGLAVLADGHPEVAAFPGPEGAAIALTLLRAVGWLSRDDFASRNRTNAGPTLFTPEAQCPGERRFRYALLPYRGNHIEQDVKGWSERWLNPPLAKQGVEAGSLPGAGLLSLATTRSAASAVKRCEDRGTLLVRLWNLTDAPLAEELRTGPPLRAAWRCSLLEEREAPLSPAGAHALPLSLGPCEILSVELEFGNG